MPESSPLKTIVKMLRREKLSPFDVQSNCVCRKPCLFAIMNPHNKSELLCMDDIAELFDFFMCNITFKWFVLLPFAQSDYTLVFWSRGGILGFSWLSDLVEHSVDCGGSICCCSFTFFRVTSYSLESEFG